MENYSMFLEHRTRGIKVAPDAHKTRRRRDEEQERHVHWGSRKRKSLKDGVGTRMDGVVENQNLEPGQGCTLIFQAATNLVAMPILLTFSLSLRHENM